MMAQSRAETTWDIYNYRKYTNQFPPNSIKAIRQYERINKKICRQKIYIMFNERYTHTHTHTHTHIYIYTHEGHTLSFPAFFVWAFKIVVDS